MPKLKKMITVSKSSKGSYKVKLPKNLPSGWPKAKPEVVDAVPIPVAGYAEVLANGMLADPKKNVSTWKISTGYYEVEFLGDVIVKSVVVQVHRAPRSPRVVPIVRPFPLSRTRRRNPLKMVEVGLVTSKGEPVDRPFAIMAITDGSLVTGKRSRKGKGHVRS